MHASPYLLLSACKLTDNENPVPPIKSYTFINVTLSLLSDFKSHLYQMAIDICKVYYKLF